MSTLVRLIPALALSLALGACDASPPPADAPADAPAAAPAAATTPPAAAAAPLVALDGEGLRLVNGDSGSTALLAFERPLDDAVTALTAALGAPKSRSTNSECGAGPVEFVQWANGLSILAQDGKFQGWSLDTAGLTTMDGLGVGSTRAELMASVPDATVEESTLGTEFAAGTLGGLFDGKGPQARVTDLWAGLTCMFR
jgi:hypothetical protein